MLQVFPQSSKHDQMKGRKKSTCRVYMGISKTFTLKQTFILWCDLPMNKAQLMYRFYRHQYLSHIKPSDIL